MFKKKSLKALKYAAGVTALSCSLNPHSIHADDELFMMNEVARGYWLHGKAGEGLCGARMKPDIEELIAAAEEGNALAAYHLGQLFEDGTWGIEQNSEKAIKWYEVAARGKIYNAIINLATIYELGRGAPQDSSKANYWFMEAQKIMHDEYIAEKIKRFQDKLK